MENITPYKYYAFLSYKSEDEKWAKRLQERIERFRLPVYLCKKNPNTPKRLKPCFRYHTDIGINELKSELQEKLENSKFLIVVCSPRSAKSEWVGEEIETFIRLGRKSNIIPFIVDGVPYSGDENECYHPVIRKHFPRSESRETDQEILGANIQEEGKGSMRTKWNKAVVKVISKMLGLEFDELWQREKRRRIRNILLLSLVCAGILCMMGFAYKHSQSYDVRFSLTETSPPNNALPPLENASLTVSFGGNTYRDTLPTIADEMVVSEVSASMMGKEAHVRITCDNYLPVDTQLILAESITIPIRRNDSVFGNISLRLLDNERIPLINREVTVHGRTSTTDSDGWLRCFIPLEEQREEYDITIDGLPDIIAPTYHLIGQSKTLNIKQ